MTKNIYLILLLLLVFSSCKTKRLYEKGTVNIEHETQQININYSRNLPLVNVTIQGKPYVFLLDTGAPTVISTKIYEELNLTPYLKGKVTDSQKNTRKQIATILPEMLIDSVQFQDIGCLVIDFSVKELACLDIAGIVGANQMAKLFWQIDYANNRALVSKNIANMDVDNFDIHIPFKPKLQKTPTIKTSILDKERLFTFDSGSGGSISLVDDKGDIIKDIPAEDKSEIYGINSMGIYGESKAITNYYFTLKNDLHLGNGIFNNVIFSTGKSNLIGNKFLENFIYVLDWKENRILLQQIQDLPKNISNFGFNYRFINNKAEVVLLFTEVNTPLQIGDIILSMNNIDLRNLDDASSCAFFINGIAEEADTLAIEVKRQQEILKYTLTKKEIFL